MAEEPPRGAVEFSIRGGPWHRLLETSGIPPHRGPGAVLRVLAVAGLAGLPLVALAIAQGVAIGGSDLPLLRDASFYARVLVAIPWILLADSFIDRRLGSAADHFVTASLVPDARRPEFDASVARIARVRESWIPDVSLLAVAVLAGWLDIRQGVGEVASSWLTTGSPARPSWAGLWFALVTLPLYNFLLLRWAWRLILWTRWLWQVSKLDLRVLATHPDRAGGLGFLAEAHLGFNLLVAPIAVVYSSRAVFWTLHGGGTVDQLRWLIAAFVVAVILVFQSPLLVFMPVLARARRRGLHEYGALAGGYTHAFHGKWLEGRNPSGEPLLGSADIQSLADIGNSFQVVKGMRIVPVDLRHLILTVIAAVLPMLPLLAIVVPVEEILKRMLSLISR